MSFPWDWYWYVGGDQRQAYSSKSGTYISSSDETFTAWIAAGNIPTNIASEAELGEVLSQYSLRPAHTNVLDGYKDAQARELTIKVVAKILLWLVNEVRALKGQQAINANQFRAFIKEQM